MIFGPFVPRQLSPHASDTAMIEHLETVMKEAEILHLYKNERSGAHPSFVAVMYGGFCAVIKPGDVPADASEMIRHERAAWLIACALGVGHMVAATVLREVELPNDAGGWRTTLASVQTVWPNCDAAPAAPLAAVDPAELVCAAAFDHVICATDRSANNWLTLTGSVPAQLKLIDHGHAFGHQGRPFLSEPHQIAKAGGGALPIELSEAIEKWLSDWPPPELPDLLDAPKLAETAARAFEVAAAGKL